MNFRLCKILERRDITHKCHKMMYVNVSVPIVTFLHHLIEVLLHYLFQIRWKNQKIYKRTEHCWWSIGTRALVPAFAAKKHTKTGQGGKAKRKALQTYPEPAPL